MLLVVHHKHQAFTVSTRYYKYYIQNWFIKILLDCEIQTIIAMFVCNVCLAGVSSEAGWSVRMKCEKILQWNENLERIQYSFGLNNLQTHWYVCVTVCMRAYEEVRDKELELEIELERREKNISERPLMVKICQKTGGGILYINSYRSFPLSTVFACLSVSSQPSPSFTSWNDLTVTPTLPPILTPIPTYSLWEYQPVTALSLGIPLWQSVTFT